MTARPGLLPKTWGDETVLFNPLTGETHVLNNLATEVVKILQRQAADARDLAHQMAGVYGLDVDGEFLGHMQRLIREMDELGLIVPRTS